MEAIHEYLVIFDDLGDEIAMAKIVRYRHAHPEDAQLGIGSQHLIAGKSDREQGRRSVSAIESECVGAAFALYQESW